jgi:hypothetical protein
MKGQAYSIFIVMKIFTIVEAPIWLEISDCSYSETRFCTDQKYTQKVKWKRSTKLIFMKFSSMKWNILCIFKVKCHRPLFMCVEVPNVYPPIVVV